MSIERLREVYSLCRRYLREAEELLNKGDAVQASKKLYKIAEECIKALAELHGLEEYRRSAKVGRWSVGRLEDAARRLARIYGDTLLTAWDAAYEKLHVRGFHERELTPNHVKEELPNIEMLLAILKERLPGK